ncbi:MAG: dihydroorotate dehydrogenase catalytic subunit [Thermosediminibacterales bacterium]|nr:dihydroorotate dehydrogenase catalytic subunit [Thermosediminibacterales bacterium]MDK2835751.1 dihydroorotate dehydrogenase catalytic subunit [Thermosediminibacterales bacterium]
MTNLAVEVAGIKLKNPVLTASGTFGFGREFVELYDLNLLGGVMVKGTTLNPRLGNPPPRIAETPAGMLNSVGLQNPGVDYVIREEIPWLRQFDVAVIVNVSGHSFDEYAEIAARLDGVPGVDGLEINISCPNVKGGGMAFGTDPKMAAEVIKRVRSKTQLPVIAKLSPNVTDITEIARAVEAEGADAVSLINTVLGMAIDIKTRRPVLANIVGGLSGPAIKPIALRMVWQVAQTVNIPIIGMGGITTAEDAIEFLLAGATAIAIGAGNFYNPMTPLEVVKGLKNWLSQEKIADVRELIGGLKT